MRGLRLVLLLAIAATSLTAFAASATPVEILSADRRVELSMRGDAYTGPSDPVEATVGPFSDSTDSTGDFDASFTGVIQWEHPDDPWTLLGDARQTSQISSDRISYSGLMSGRVVPGLVTPDVYSGLAVLPPGTLPGQYGSVDGVSTLDVVFAVQSLTDFSLELALQYDGAPQYSPEVSLENLDTEELIFLREAYFPTDPLAGTLEPGTYALSATAGFVHWCPCSREAPGGSLDFDLSFATPVPEPGTAALLLEGVMGLLLVRRRAGSAARSRLPIS